MAGRRVALLVAFDQFVDPRLSELRAPQADIDALSTVLSDPDLGGFTVERLVNGTSQEFRLAVLRLFGQREPDDFCLLHISSHGLKDASGELYLATSDTQREYLDATSVEAAYVRRQLDRSRAGAGVVLLDCCYGGAFERGMATRADGDVDLSGALVAVNEGRGRAVMTASTAIEYAFEGTELHPGAPSEPSVFTEAVVTGIRQGSMDASRDGVLTLGELFSFVSRRVRQRNAHQTPQWWLYGASGDLVIARNPNPVVTPKNLPEDLLDVLRLPQPAARLGAVLALRQLMDADPGTALAAYRTLETLTGDDSRRVSSAAAEALSEIQVTAQPSAIDLGDVTVGDEVFAAIQLDGVLAPACQLKASDPAVRLTRRGNRVEVHLDTSRPTVVDGRIEVIGPSGGAVVSVVARVADLVPASDPQRPAAEPPTRPTPEPVPLATVSGPAPKPEPAPEVASPPLSEPHATTKNFRMPTGASMLIATWLAVAATLVLGLREGTYTGQNWYESLTDKYLSRLSAIASPVAMLGTQLARTGRARLSWAAALVGTAFVALPVAVGLMLRHESIHQELVIEVIGATVVIGLAATLAVQAYRRIAPSTARPALVTTILVWVLVVGAVAALAPMQAQFDWPGDVVVLWLLATLSLVLPLEPRLRVAVGALVVGAMVTVVLYFVGPDPPEGAAPTVAGCLLIAVVVVVHLRPVYLSLHDQSAAQDS